MGREIKFRAWDVIDEKMQEVVCIDKPNNRIVFNKNEKEYTVASLCLYELTQYTGLKDKNGVEIYEGDKIVLLDENDEETSNVGFVEWLNTFGFWNVSHIEDGLGDLMINNSVVVIGNIHENKELLEG